MPVGTAQFGQADLSKTEAHTEAPMTQLGRAAASGSIIDHVWLAKKFSERICNEPNQTNFQPSFLICCFGKYAGVKCFLCFVQIELL